MTLTIDRLTANYFMPAQTPDTQRTQQRLDTLVRQRLPAELNGRLHPPARDQTAIYRIRHLEIDLWVDIAGMSDTDIARRWSQLLLRTVTQALLTGSPADVVRFDDPAHYLAAFLIDLLAGRAWSVDRGWVYAEFAPLRGLAMGQSAASLLSARPEWLLPVAQHLHRAHQLEPLLRQMTRADVALLAKALDWQEPAAVISAERLDTLLPRLRAIPLERGGRDALARNLLRLFLAATLPQPELARQSWTAATCTHLAWLHQLWAARPAPLLWQALAREEIDGLAPLQPLLDGLDGDLDAPRRWLTLVMNSEQGRAYVGRLVRNTQRETEDAQPATASARSLATSFAGLGLLLPFVRELGWYESLDHAGLYQLLLRLVGRDHVLLAWADGAAAWLAGVPDHLAAQARVQAVTWPDVMAWGDAVDWRASADEAAIFGDWPGSGAALFLLRRFARGLRGYAGISPATLIRQFIHLPGQIQITPTAIEIRCTQAPLGIILRMASRDGPQGRIPWLDNRELRIILP